MGVKNLWTLLSPVAEKMPLWELQGKAVSIDLSGWVCDSENFNQNTNQKNMYLRNLFFRTSNLLLIGAIPIFVLEGEAPKLKHDIIEKRLNGNIKGPAKKTIVRKRLNILQKQCELLLNIMGVTCVYSPGEAEQLCAILNKNEIVNGVVTQDSDCFLYGARIIYRNFNASGNGSIDVYRMESIEKNLKIGRNKMIALSLLCGCDYDEQGVLGIGKETAIKFLQLFDDDVVLDRMRSWRTDKHLNLTENIKSKTNETMLELKIRNKALENKSFPSETIIEEFLNEPECSEVTVKWIQPNIEAFITFALSKLCWEKKYAIDKFLPLLTRWHLIYDDNLVTNISINKIVKNRINKGIKCYEIKWNNYEITTIEPQTAVQIRYQKEVLIYETLHTKNSKKHKKKLPIHDSNLINVTNKLSLINISKEEVKTKQNNEANNKGRHKGPLDQFIRRKKVTEDSLTLSDFECDSVDLDLSDIVNRIIA